MALHYFRILYASQGGPEQPVTTKAGPTLREPGGDYEGMHKQLKRVFNAKPGKRYGRFSTDLGDAPVQAWLKDYLEEKQSFESLTDKLLAQWGELLGTVDLDYQGAIAIAHEQLAEGQVLYIWGLETDASLFLDNRLSLDQGETLSLSRLNLAARIEVDDWLAAEPAQNYITLVQARGTGDLGERFAQLAGFESSVDVDKETQTFLDAVEAFAREGDAGKAQAVRTRAYEFCKDQGAAGEPVPLEALSGYLDEENPERFTEFVSQAQSLPAQTVLHPDQRKVRKLVRISGTGNGLSVSFSSDLMNQAVYYDRNQGQLTITKVPKALREQLDRYLERGQEDNT
ncbi:nucleoid-associated protein [Hydrocarboniclastica marina]|uniref:Nucleoid-associated protein n=1 Tax=Hydrocarboniclastica marina TaxID=2259620 RepID=A0A4P7XHS5_9ALTE|nr:nucleoid-associated protein [Hydrocarboniclastica marina]QCF26591.1 nucleoid-associated protein [Hydrocarboniclastica marina]